MKQIFLLMIYAFTTVAGAQSAQLDGTWLKQGVDAFDRSYVTRNGNADDLSRTTELLAFVTAVVSVQRQNNLLALLVSSGIKKSTDNNGQVKLDEVDAGRVQTAAMFTPLRALPDRLSPEQVVAIVSRFLISNPQRWGESAAGLVTDALREAFNKK